MSGKIPSGNAVFDQLLQGGFETDIITTIYGPAGSGKTNVCMLCAIGVARSGRKVLYIDTDNSFSVLRLQQIAPEYLGILDKMVFLQPLTFDEQKESFQKLRELTAENIGLIIVDSISMLYRLEIGKTDDIYEVNKELGLQLGYLTELARKLHIPVLVTNQVYADFDNKENVRMVGGDLLKYGSKCLIELRKFRKGRRAAVLRKHRSLAEDTSADFTIVETGFDAVNE
ncbi:MAG TPA: DNA repair and recombination protein RadB [Candidatus Nanoarchaeia archaeon]|nr:DNA repair and recombination protein RadB [Candidatus Nanoarchaeia archaeon]